MGCSGSKSTGTTSNNTSSSSASGKIELYEWPGSAPCRAVFFAVGALGIHEQIAFKEVDLIKEEQKGEEFKKINPNGKVPVIKEGSHILWESRAIMKYLCEKFPKSGASLYPEDAEKRAEVDKVLMHEQSSLYASIGDYLYPQILEQKPADEEAGNKLSENLDKMNEMLQDKKYLTGDDLTIADLSTIASVTTLELLDYDFSKWENITKWMNTMKELPYYTKCQEGLEGWKQMIKSMGQNAQQEE